MDIFPKYTKGNSTQYKNKLLKKKEKWEEYNFIILLQQWSFYFPVQTGYNTSIEIKLFPLSYIPNT